MRWLSIVFCVLAIEAQTVTTQPGSIGGRVTNSVTGDLIPGAALHLLPLRYKGDQSTPLQTNSQSDGSFHFDSVPPGIYVVIAERDGFVPNQSNAVSHMVPVQPGQTVGDVAVQLTPQGTIAGKVVDDEGKPVPGANVRALSKSQSGSTATTDASGNFQLFKLMPGDYYIWADPLAKAQDGFVRTIYPHSLNFDDAATIPVTAGQTASEITIRLRQAATYHIKGKISEPPDGARPQKFRITITPRLAIDATLLARSAGVNADRTFEIDGLVPGSYTLRLTGQLSRTGGSNRLLARQDVEIGSSSLEDVRQWVSLKINSAMGSRTTISLPSALRTDPAFRLRIPLRPSPLKQTRYPKRMSDTICIAAVCSHRPGKHCVILCSDEKIEVEGVGSGEAPHKSLLLTAEFSAMISGDVSKSKVLTERFRTHLAKVKITEDNVFDELQKPLDIQSRAEVSEYISGAFGISYRVFEKSSHHERSEMLAQMGRKIAELIIIWLSAPIPRLFVVSTAGGVTEYDGVAIVGSGLFAAQAALFGRKYSPMRKLDECMYHVFEAKKNSEAVPGVGGKTFLNVLEYDKQARVTVIHPFGYHSLKCLDQQYATFGPKPFAAEDCPVRLDLKSLGL